MIHLFDESTFMGDEDSPSPWHLFDFIFLNFILCWEIYWLWPEQCVKVRLIKGKDERDTGQDGSF